MSDNFTVALSVSSFGVSDPQPLETLRATGAQVIANPHGRRLSAAEAAELIREADGLIAGTEPLTAEVLASAPKLRVISRVGIGLDSVDLEAAKKRGIVVHNTPDAVTDPVAELTLAGILSVLRNLTQGCTDIRAGRWERPMGRLLRGRTVGIVGCGRIGSRLLELLAPFHVHALVTDPALDSSDADALGVELVGFDTLLSRSDIVTLHLPPNPTPIITEREFALMKPGVIFVNAARGSLVDENALANSLRSEKLGAAYLDTFNEEPYSGVLTEFKNVLLTPHVGSYAAEARAQMELEATHNLLAALGKGNP